MGWGLDRSTVVGDDVVQESEEEEGKDEEGKEEEREDESNAGDGSDNDATSKGDGEREVAVVDDDGDVCRGEHPRWRVC